jgi:hypothetical protein
VDGSRFDALTRSLSVPGSRRRLIVGLAAGALGLTGGRAAVAACRKSGSVCREHANCCAYRCLARDATGRRRCAPEGCLYCAGDGGYFTTVDGPPVHRDCQPGTTCRPIGSCAILCDVPETP